MVKWATFLWNVGSPLLRAHFWYYQRKTILDRYLERRHPFTNVIFSFLFGSTVFFLISPQLPTEFLRTLRNRAKEAERILKDMGVDSSAEMPTTLIKRVERDLEAKILLANDEWTAMARAKEVSALRDKLRSESVNLKSDQ